MNLRLQYHLCTNVALCSNLLEKPSNIPERILEKKDRSANTSERSDPQYTEQDIHDALAEMNFKVKTGKGGTQDVVYIKPDKNSSKNVNMDLKMKNDDTEINDLENMISNFDENEPINVKDKKRINLKFENQQRKELERK